MRRNWMTALLCASLVACLAGCGDDKPASPKGKDDGKSFAPTTAGKQGAAATQGHGKVD